MNIWYFTFCGRHSLRGFCQPIVAASYGEARATMVELHGSQWGFQYSEEEWKDAKVYADKRGYQLEKELPIINTTRIYITTDSTQERGENQ
jgi:hypothetical protein